MWYGTIHYYVENAKYNMRNMLPLVSDMSPQGRGCARLFLKGQAGQGPVLASRQQARNGGSLVTTDCLPGVFACVIVGTVLSWIKAFAFLVTKGGSSCACPGEVPPALGRSHLPCALPVFNLGNRPSWLPNGVHSKCPFWQPISRAEFHFSKPTSPWEIFFLVLELFGLLGNPCWPCPGQHPWEKWGCDFPHRDNGRSEGRVWGMPGGCQRVLSQIQVGSLPPC